MATTRCCLLNADIFRMRFIVLSLLVTFQLAFAQSRWLPEPVTNNAVVALQKNGSSVFYSFYGLDSTKTWSGVHNKIFRFDPVTGLSFTIGKLPDIGRLAASASAIDNKAYLVGGYAVFKSGKEKSSDRLFIFDPTTEMVIQGANLPLRIDDHVQGVWRNKLLYVISGWSDSLNVNTVQVYNPKIDQWALATGLPNEAEAKVFGGCGTIAGDTIYMLGGATFAKYYPPSQTFYKGVIDVNNPLHITWINAGQYPGEHRYRSAALVRGNRIYFIGGSDKTYNYTGISYAEQKPIAPNSTNLLYDQLTGKFTVQETINRVMDLRGAILDAKGNMYTMGGMLPGQKVSKEVRLIIKK